MLNLILESFVYYIPAYFVNAGILLVYSLFGIGISLSPKIFGTQRNFGGLFFSIFCGGAIGLLVSSFWLGIFLGIGAWLGALGGSFLKRRVGMKSGSSAPLLDQLDFIIGATLLGCLILPPKFEHFLIILLVTPFIHRATNIIAFRLGIKNVPY